MEKQYNIYFKNIKVNVVDAKNDSVHQVQISVLGEPSFTKKPFNQYHDQELESQGYIKLADVNGSLFFSELTNTYANGIEKAFGIVNENDDDEYDNNMGFYHNDTVPYIYTQRYIKSIINQP